MFDSTRRGFLKATSFLLGSTTVVGGSTIQLLTEPKTDFSEFPAQKDWIEDRGSFYLVRVPESKTLRNERFDKPTIFILRNDSLVEGVQIKGFANVLLNGASTFRDTLVDASLHGVEARSRAVLLVHGDYNSKSPNLFERLHVVGPVLNPARYGIEFTSPTHGENANLTLNSIAF